MAPKRPLYMYNRWQEDWSVLADPRTPREPLDALKYIPLSEGDPKTYLSLGGSLRARFETNDARNFGVGSTDDSYVIARLEAHADLRVGPFQAFVQLDSAEAPGKRVIAPVDRNRIDLEQGFVAFVHPLGDGTLKLRVGRQQFAFDLQRFVSARDGPNIRQSYDAIWGNYEIGKWRFIAYYTQPVVNRDLRAFDDYSNSHQTFSGFRVERLVFGKNELSAYWSRFTDDQARYVSVAGRERRDVYDVRFAGKRGALDWDLEAMGQTGSIVAQRIRAWAVGTRGGYTFASARWSPRLGLQIDAASGDDNRNDHTLGTFNPLFPNGNYVNLAGYTGYTNFIHVKPSLTVKPTSRLTALFAVAGEWRMTTADAVYTQPDVPVAGTAGVGGRYTGTYGQVRLDWQATSHVTGALEAVHFAIGETVRRAGGGNGDYLGLELKYYW